MPFAVAGISKAFSGIPVLSNVDLSVNDGEIHALLGANGAGKSTLIKCISGAHTPDAGEIIIEDRAYRSLTPKESRNAGVFVIYQELSLAASLDVSDNVFLGQEIRYGPFVRRRREREEVRRWLGQLGVHLDPRANLNEISNAQLQIVEIIKALKANPKILILDEPTSSLTDAETQQLSRYLRTLKKQGIPILYVTHRLGEVFALADRVSVLRGGEIVLSERTRETREEALVQAIIGRDTETAGAKPSRVVAEGAPLLCRGVDLLSPGIGPINFEVRSGEILGVYGLTGSGRTELLETCFGARRIFGGYIEMDGNRLDLEDPAGAVAHGIALVPSDRLRKSLWGTLTAQDNILMPTISHIGRWGFRRSAREQERFVDVAKRLDLQPPRADQEAQRFSGGNQQKLVIGRWMQKGDHTRLLMLDEPTQGVDVGARKDLYDALRSFAASKDRAVIVTSSEPTELAQLAHKVIVLSSGRAVGTFAGSDITELNLLKAVQHQPAGSPM
jgi:ribose transport system ATP-binding protein